MTQYETVGFGQINILNQNEKLMERYEALAETLENSAVDFLSIQEIVSPDKLFSVLEQVGYSYQIIGSMLPNNHGTSNTVGIVSKTPVEKIEFENHWDFQVIGGKTVAKDQSYNVFSAHLAWGPFNGFTRLEQASLMEKIAAEKELENPASVSLIGGDLNADPDSRPVRFLKGKDLGSDNKSSTFWLDAHDLSGNEDNWATSDHAVNPYGIKSAMNNGVIDTSFIPRRRIDYIFVRGWRYGKNGCPVNFDYLTHPKGTILSDHNGIFAELAIIN